MNDQNFQYSDESQIPSPPPTMSASLSLGRLSMFAFVFVLGGIAIGWAGPHLVKTAWQKATASAMFSQRTQVPGGYQAVFLTNGQVYFGKVDNGSTDPVVLRNVYYLQVTQQLQPEPNPSVSPNAVPQISLVKLGNELHGPKDEMRITRSQVLFIEDLKDDSQVVKAISAAK
jgi:hypothetical protein